jgi:hypothetical protein
MACFPSFLVRTGLLRRGGTPSFRSRPSKRRCAARLRLCAGNEARFRGGRRSVRFRGNPGRLVHRFIRGQDQGDPRPAHPRDLFDIRDLLANEGIADELRQGLIVYLISHGRPSGDTAVLNQLLERASSADSLRRDSRWYPFWLLLCRPQCTPFEVGAGPRLARES